MTPISESKTITVIVAAYKAQSYIHQALASILKQKLPPGWKLELLLGIDNCHVTKRVVAGLEHPSLKKYWMTSNRGTYITFNTMMKYATGEYILRFDADDIMHEGMIKAGIEEMEKGRGLLQFKCEEFPISGKRVPHGILMFSRKAWDRVGGFLPWRCGADTDFIQKVKSSAFSTKQLQNRVYFSVRKGTNTLTTNSKTGFGSRYRQKRQHQVEKNDKLFKKFIIKGVPLAANCVKI